MWGAPRSYVWIMKLDLLRRLLPCHLLPKQWSGHGRRARNGNDWARPLGLESKALSLRTRSLCFASVWRLTPLAYPIQWLRIQVYRSKLKRAFDDSGSLINVSATQM